MDELATAPLANMLAKDLGENCTRLDIAKDPDYIDLFNNLIRHAGLADNPELAVPAITKKSEEMCDDYYFRMFFRITKSDRKYEQLQSSLLEYDGQLVYDYWRKVGVERKFTEAQAEIFLCCSTFVHDDKTLKRHLAEFFQDCRVKGTKLNTEKDFEDVVSRLIKEELGKIQSPPDRTKSACESVHQIHLDLPPYIESNTNYFGTQFIDVLGRDDEQERLREFLYCDKRYAWFQLAGVAGQGKSRLALELAIEVRDRHNWNAGFLEDYEIKRTAEIWDEWQPDKPHLIILDYVFGRTTSIHSIFKALAHRREQFQHPVRLLLLERQPWNRGFQKPSDELPTPVDLSETRAAWFLDFTDRYDGNDVNIVKSRFPKDEGVLELGKLNEDKLVDIVKQVVEKTPNAVPLTITKNQIKEQLEHIDKEGRPLYAYFLARELAFGTNTQGWSHTELLNAVLWRERENWWAAAFDGQKPPLLEDDLPSARLAVLATMTDGLDCSNVDEFLNFDASSRTRKQALALTGGEIHKSISGPSEIITAMKPDLLGEWYVLSSFEKGIPIEEITAIAWRYKPEKMASFIQHLSQDFINHPLTKSMLNCVNLEQIDLDSLSKIADSLFRNFHFEEKNIHDDIIRALHIAADNKDPEATKTLGWCYKTGTGVVQDKRYAIELYEKAIELGNTWAISLLARCYTEGDDAKKNVYKAIELYQMGIEIGDSLSMYNLACIYHYNPNFEQFSAEAINLYEKASKAGIAQATNNLGSCYETGYGVEKDCHKAVELYKKAAASGIVEAMNNLGLWYKREKGTEQNLQKAFEWFQKAAERNHSSSMNSLGRCYEEGKGIEQNLQKAFEWFQKAAERNHSSSMTSLGICYEKGKGIEQNLQKAFEWFQKAAEAGCPYGMNNLGNYYKSGKCTEIDIHRATELYQQSAELGNITAMRNLADCYENGTGVAQNVHEAVKWYQRSAEGGDAQAMFELAIYELKHLKAEEDVAKVIQWLEKAIESGSIAAMCVYGRFLEVGDLIDQDIHRAIQFFEKAAEAGVAIPMYQLGIIHEEGNGVEKNIHCGLEWFQKAADAGHAEAMYKVGLNYEKGITVEQNSQRAFEWFYKAAEAGYEKAMYITGLCYLSGDGVEQDFVIGYEWTYKAADAGYESAMHCLGLLYQKGEGVKKNACEATKWYQRAAEAGVVGAMNNLGLCYLKGIGVKRNPTLAAEWLQKAVDTGDAEAMSNLCLCYLSGIGVKRDFSKAYELAKMSAEACTPLAMWVLGYCLLTGLGVEQNVKLATYWFKRSAEETNMRDIRNPFLYLIFFIYRSVTKLFKKKKN